MTKLLCSLLVLTIIFGSIGGILVFLIIWMEKDFDYAWDKFYCLVLEAVE